MTDQNIVAIVALVVAVISLSWTIWRDASGERAASNAARTAEQHAAAAESAAKHSGEQALASRQIAEAAEQQVQHLARQWAARLIADLRPVSWRPSPGVIVLSNVGGGPARNVSVYRKMRSGDVYAAPHPGTIAPEASDVSIGETTWKKVVPPPELPTGDIPQESSEQAVFVTWDQDDPERPSANSGNWLPIGSSR